MKQYAIFALGILLAVACDPIDAPVLPTLPGGGSNDSTFVDNDSTVVGGDSMIVVPDGPVVADSLGLMDMDIVFDSADEKAYKDAPETIITDEAHDDYGDFIENYSPKNTVTITFKEGSASYSAVPSGVMVTKKNAHVTIESTKKNIAYVLKGSTTNGSFRLYSDKKAQITLNGVSITNPTGAAINIQSGKTMLVKLADGTTNSLEDGTSYTLADGEQQKGTFFSEGQLVFSGNGALDVKSNYGHGIASDDYVRIREGEFDINSVRDGISTKERFIMYGGFVNVVAQQDGIDVSEGYIEIGGGHLTIEAVDEGITASYEGDDYGNIDPEVNPYIDIRGGFIKATTTGDKGHALRAMSTFDMSGGIVQAHTLGAGSKALLSENDMTLAGGKITAITEGDALYESDVDELSSSAAIRSKGKLTMDGMIVGVKSIGQGSKGVNNVGDIVAKSCHVKVVALGADYTYNNASSYSYGISTDGSLSVSGGSLLIKAMHTPIDASTQQIADDVIYGAVATE